MKRVAAALAILSLCAGVVGCGQSAHEKAEQKAKETAHRFYKGVEKPQQEHEMIEELTRACEQTEYKGLSCK